MVNEEMARRMKVEYHGYSPSKLSWPVFLIGIDLIWGKAWDLIPLENGLAQWKCIEDHFEFDYVAGVKWTWSTLGERWKAYKYKLRCQHFYPNKSKEEILANRPSRVPPSEWVTFVNHYKNDQMKKVSEQNTRNRQQLKVSHAGGATIKSTYMSR
ncbi:hypothetical protein P8452_73507 [Trifolium repens]|nr:hypothetical protein P8452_73507 [Trifolium repens]